MISPYLAMRVLRHQLWVAFLVYLLLWCMKITNWYFYIGLHAIPHVLLIIAGIGLYRQGTPFRVGVLLGSVAIGLLGTLLLLVAFKDWKLVRHGQGGLFLVTYLAGHCSIMAMLAGIARLAMARSHPELAGQANKDL